MADWSELLPDLLDVVHGRLSLLNRLAFGAVCASWRRVHRAASGPGKPEAPWLVLPGPGRRSAALHSLSEGRTVIAHVPRPAMRSRVVIGSSAGWLVTADYWESRLHLLNPFTGAQAELPALTTMPCLYAAPGNKFVFDLTEHARIQFGDSVAWLPPMPAETFCRSRLRRAFLRKVVLSPSTRPGTHAHEAMLLRRLGDGPAFAAGSDGGEWRLEAAPLGADDAIYHKGRFYSVAGDVVESWERLDLASGDCMYRSTVVTSKLAEEGDVDMCKYLVESPAGQLMLLFRRYRRRDRKTRSFKVEVLDDERGLWEVVQDVGEVAFFVGINESLCLPTREYPELKPRCVYFTDDDSYAWLKKQEPRDVGVYSLKDGKVEQIESLGQHRSWPPAAWIMPRLSRG